MKFKNIDSEIFIPDNKAEEDAIIRTTHMAIAAHPDDIEMMALDGVLKCFNNDEKWFLGVVVASGYGSPRNGIYSNFNDFDMEIIRKKEQKKAATLGEYGAVIQLNYKIAKWNDVKNIEMSSSVINELKDIICKAKPEIIYTHNLVDKHYDHIATAIWSIEALRQLPKKFHPDKLYGCEVWRSLDWVNDDEKIIFNVDEHPNLSLSLLGVHDSQICGGKRYDNAAVGRRMSNATYCVTNEVDNVNQIIYGMDLTPLINDINLDINEYICGYIKRFNNKVSYWITDYFNNQTKTNI